MYKISGLHRWGKITIPFVFKDLTTGLITAAGGAWNATIVAEYFVFRNTTLKVQGLGAMITEATLKGDVAGVLLSTFTMAAVVVLFNRLVWRQMYRLAETRFKWE